MKELAIHVGDTVLYDDNNVVPKWRRIHRVKLEALYVDGKRNITARIVSEGGTVRVVPVQHLFPQEGQYTNLNKGLE